MGSVKGIQRGNVAFRLWLVALCSVVCAACGPHGASSGAPISGVPTTRITAQAPSARDSVLHGYSSRTFTCSPAPQVRTRPVALRDITALLVCPLDPNSGEVGEAGKVFTPDTGQFNQLLRSLSAPVPPDTLASGGTCLQGLIVGPEVYALTARGAYDVVRPVDGCRELQEQLLETLASVLR